VVCFVASNLMARIFIILLRGLGGDTPRHFAQNYGSF
jgi:hypothetical protein